MGQASSINMVNALRPSPATGVRCRSIEESDIDNIVALLTAGFPTRSHNYWQRALARLSAHAAPPGMPRFGYLLEHGGVAVGVILLVSSLRHRADGIELLCNFSSWCVAPEFRSHASMLVARALKTRQVTFVNISPSPHTLATIEAQGFRRRTNGQFLAFAAMAHRTAGEVTVVRAGSDLPTGIFDPADAALLSDHAEYGCISLWCKADEKGYPFVFMPRRLKGFIPCAQLVYCRSEDEFLRFARPLGRYLALRGRPLILLDANGAIAELAGLYFEGKYPRYFRGAKAPVINDLAYTELVMFGP